jgi:hypothetical protein
VATIEFKIVTGRDRPNLIELAKEITTPCWPEFMLHDAVAIEHWQNMYEKFPDCQFGLADRKTDRLLAIGNSVPFHWQGDPYDLPEDGWDWAILQSLEDAAAGKKPTMLSAIQIAIPEDYRGTGLSSIAVEIMKEIGEQLGCLAMVAPVRPTRKCLYPLIPMQDYITWKDDRDRPFDPWIRIHVKLGAEILNICDRAMRIEGSVAEWEAWTGMPLPSTGQYIVEGALVPVEINRESDQGLYIEPNVWLGHPIR